ncbi:hypothetical protein VTJ83DRAFT_2764 [Remersonia thermophila]|uniref:Uncharacterized protein n=1 Tax=Remersonia thermophila TaxID=72144 RepID=A0ABR4DJR1_9PEZI
MVDGVEQGAWLAGLGLVDGVIEAPSRKRWADGVRRDRPCGNLGASVGCFLGGIAGAGIRVCTPIHRSPRRRKGGGRTTGEPGHPQHENDDEFHGAALVENEGNQQAQPGHPRGHPQQPSPSTTWHTTRSSSIHVHQTQDISIAYVATYKAGCV